MKFIFDLDGTICFRGNPLSALIVHALDSLTEAGHEVIFASARPIRDLLPVLPVHMQHYPMIGGNGAFVANGGNILSTTPFDRLTAAALIRLIRDFGADYLVDSSWDYAYSGSSEHPIRRNLDPLQKAKNIPIDELNEIVKAVVLRSDDREHLLEELRKLPVVIHMHGQEGIIDISPQGVDKWNGLQQLGVVPQQFYAFGNDANDLSMFRRARHSVCVGEHAELSRLATESVSGDEALISKKIIDFIGNRLYILNKVNE